MKLSDIKRIIREELSEGDVVNFGKFRKKQLEKEIEQKILDTVSSSTGAFMAGYKDLDQVQEQYEVYGDRFMNKLMKYVFDQAVNNKKSRARMINHMMKMHKNNPVWTDHTKLLAAFKEGLFSIINIGGEEDSKPEKPKKPSLYVVDPELGPEEGADDDSDF